MVLDTPIGQIELALDGMVEFHNMTNGIKPDEPEQQAEAKEPDPAKAAQALFGFLRGKASGKGQKASGRR